MQAAIKMENIDKYRFYIISILHRHENRLSYVSRKCWPPWETSWKWRLPLIFGQIKSKTISHRRQQSKKEREQERERERESSFESSQSVSQRDADPFPGFRLDRYRAQLQLIVIEPSSLETRLCSRSNQRIYVTWEAKGKAAACAPVCIYTHLDLSGMPISLPLCVSG